MASYFEGAVGCAASQARKQATSVAAHASKQSQSALHSASARHAPTCGVHAPTPDVAATLHWSQVGAAAVPNVLTYC
jgi:hypothetical protein